jgi:hypothetical protein
MSTTSIKTAAASRLSGPTGVRLHTEYTFDFSDVQDPSHQWVGGAPADDDTENAAQTIQDDIQSHYTQPGGTLSQALTLSNVRASNIIDTSYFDATIKVWPPK